MPTIAKLFWIAGVTPESDEGFRSVDRCGTKSFEVEALCDEVRLADVSYQRQLEAGMKNPGRAGLTADRIGDSERWEPKHHQDGEAVDQDGMSQSSAPKP